MKLSNGYYKVLQILIYQFICGCLIAGQLIIDGFLYLLQFICILKLNFLARWVSLDRAKAPSYAMCNCIKTVAKKMLDKSASLQVVVVTDTPSVIKHLEEQLEGFAKVLSIKLLTYLKITLFKFLLITDFMIYTGYIFQLPIIYKFISQS